MSLSVITAAAQEPLLLEEVKADRRVDGPDDDAIFSRRIAGARAECEHYTRLKLMTQTVRLTLDQFPAGAIRLPVWPVQSIDQVQYVDDAGATQTLAASGYQLVESRKPRLLAPAFEATWPITRAYYGSVMIDIVAGFGTASSDLPQDLVDAMLMIIGGRDEFREQYVEGAQVAEVPMGAYTLMQRHVFHP